MGKVKNFCVALYELDNYYYEALESAIHPETGEIIDESMFKFLDEIKAKKDEKSLNIACMIKSYLSEAQAYKQEKERLQARQEAAESKAESLTKYLMRHIEPGEKIKDERASISWRKSSSIKILCDIDELPLQYKKVKIEPDKRLMKTFLKQETGTDENGLPIYGNEIPGVEIEEKQNIQIK